MASPNQQQQSFSNLLSQAHETLYTSTPMNTCQRLLLAGPCQQNPTTSMRSNLWLIMFIVETNISIEIFGRALSCG
jgi:hypothetical protein